MNDWRQLCSATASHNPSRPETRGGSLLWFSPLQTDNAKHAENIGSLHQSTIQMIINNGKSRKRDGTQDIGLCVLPEPTILWIGQRRQYKSAIRFVKPAIFKTPSQGFRF